MTKKVFPHNAKLERAYRNTFGGANFFHLPAERAAVRVAPVVTAKTSPVKSVIFTLVLIGLVIALILK